jgi:hypothetical protein
VPFFLACGVAIVAFFVTSRLDPSAQKCHGRIATEAANTQPVVVFD